MNARGIDFAELIFDDLKIVHQKKRDVIVPYLIFLSLVIKRVLKERYGLDHNGDSFGSLASLLVAKLGASVFTHKPTFGVVGQ